MHRSPRSHNTFFLLEQPISRTMYTADFMVDVLFFQDKDEVDAPVKKREREDVKVPDSKLDKRLQVPFRYFFLYPTLDSGRDLRLDVHLSICYMSASSPSVCIFISRW